MSSDVCSSDLVDKVKDELQKVIDLLESGETDTEVVQETLDEAVCGCLLYTSVPKRLTIIRANRYMVERSDFLIAYVRHPASNAKELLELSLIHILCPVV